MALRGLFTEKKMLNLEKIIHESLTDVELVLFYGKVKDFNATKGYAVLEQSRLVFQSKANSAVKYIAYRISVLDGEYVIAKNSNGARTMPMDTEEFLIDIRRFIRGETWL